MVIGLKRAGWSKRQIAADTHLGASTVHRLWRRWLEQGNVAIYRNVGATRVTSARVDRRILRQAVAAPQATCTAILQHVQDTLDHSISTRTISRRLVANGLHSCRPLRRLTLTPPNRRQRLEWCRARSTWMTEWHRVVFSDESRFCLSSDSRRVRVWRRRGERSNPAAIVERPTVRQRGIMGVPNALYQQDNARPHTARISQQALQDVQMLPWPPYSPDLSPIEHVWDFIGRRLHALPQPRSEDELWQMVEREWRAIPQDAIRTLIDSLPRRVAACIAVRALNNLIDNAIEFCRSSFDPETQPVHSKRIIVIRNDRFWRDGRPPSVHHPGSTGPRCGAAPSRATKQTRPSSWPSTPCPIRPIQPRTASRVLPAGPSTAPSATDTGAADPSGLSSERPSTSSGGPLTCRPGSSAGPALRTTPLPPGVGKVANISPLCPGWARRRSGGPAHRLVQDPPAPRFPSTFIFHHFVNLYHIYVVFRWSGLLYRVVEKDDDCAVVMVRMPGNRKRRQFKQTDAFTRGMVIGLKRAGWSIRQIAADTHLGASTVHRLWRRWLEQGNVAIYRNVGATRVTSARVDRRILRQAVAAPQATCTAILQHVQDTLDHSISTRTISRRLVANGLHSCRPLRRLTLTPPNRRQRLEWCRARSTWMTEWHRVVFSDESRFCLSSDSRRVRVWRRRGERSNPAAIVERPPCDNGVPNALYQQDNARPHTARISQQALQDVQMLPWPPYSPDLSPIEHVWDSIGRRLHALPQPRSEDELWQMVEREWRAIPQDAIRTLIDSLPRRVAACIAVR
ncbi:hypothetical protein LAZ67_9001732, partial [Cordylochernes scorpioides]